MNTWIDRPFEGEVKTQQAAVGHERSRVDIRMKPIYKELTTGGVRYFCLFRNNDMDLEAFKADRKNALLFVAPLAEVLIERKIKNVAPAPKGDHTKLNGFHFCTDIVERAAALAGAKVHTPFLKSRTITKTDKCPKDCVIIDDIITRGTTMAACLRALGSHRDVLILLTNH